MSPSRPAAAPQARFAARPPAPAQRSPFAARERLRPPGAGLAAEAGRLNDGTGGGAGLSSALSRLGSAPGVGESGGPGTEPASAFPPGSAPGAGRAPADAATVPAGPAAAVSRAARTGIPAPVLGAMERHFAEDFSTVRVHSESAAARRLSALAYTQGEEVHFAPGRFRPDTQAGRALLGHELAHVRQQRAGRVAPTVRLVSGVELNDSPELEREAEREGAAAAAAFASGRPAADPGVPPPPGDGDGASAAGGPPPAPGGRSAAGFPVQRSADAADVEQQWRQDLVDVEALLAQAEIAILEAEEELAPAPPGPRGTKRRVDEVEVVDVEPAEQEREKRPRPEVAAVNPGGRRRAAEDEPEDPPPRRRARPDLPLQLKAKATGFGGGKMNHLAPRIKAHPGVAKANIIYGPLRPVSKTSTAVQTTDLHKQPPGTPVGATRPNDWAKFVAMANAPKEFVQGHSLSQKLGGKGIHANLSPFTRSLNATHEKRVESRVIKQTAGKKGKWADYDVGVVYKGNPGIAKWSFGKFKKMPVKQQRAAMTAAGVLTKKQAAALKGKKLPAATAAKAQKWIAKYVKNTFPTYINCRAVFIDQVKAGFKQTAPQKVKITNDR